MCIMSYLLNMDDFWYPSQLTQNSEKAFSSNSITILLKLLFKFQSFIVTKSPINFASDHWSPSSLY